MRARAGAAADPSRAGRARISPVERVPMWRPGPRRQRVRDHGRAAGAGDQAGPGGGRGSGCRPSASWRSGCRSAGSPCGRRSGRCARPATWSPAGGRAGGTFVVSHRAGAAGARRAGRRRRWPGQMGDDAARRPGLPAGGRTRCGRASPPPARCLRPTGSTWSACLAESPRPRPGNPAGRRLPAAPGGRGGQRLPVAGRGRRRRAAEARPAAGGDPGDAAATSSTRTPSTPRIVDAILAGDADGARAVMEEHCDAHGGAAARVAGLRPLGVMQRFAEYDHSTEMEARRCGPTPLTLEELRLAVAAGEIDTVVLAVHRHAGPAAGQAVPRPLLPRRGARRTAPRAATTCSPSTST